jgi:hypothetical protein
VIIGQGVLPSPVKGCKIKSVGDKNVPSKDSLGHQDA